MKCEFKVVKATGSLASSGDFTLAIEHLLNRYAKDGWQPHQISIQEGKDIADKYAIVILKKEVES